MFWYEDEVIRVEKSFLESGKVKPAVFYGSGTINFWSSVADELDELNVFNAGFGGSTISACCWFYERLIKPMSPSSIILYAGENDLGDNRHPEEVCMMAKFFIDRLRENYPHIPFTFISIKPSPARWNIIDRINYTNEIVKYMISFENNAFFLDVHSEMVDRYGHPNPALFNDDGLHLSYEGYQLWKKLIEEHKNFIFRV